MIAPRTWAIVGTSFATVVLGGRALSTASASTNRVFVPVRKEMELNPLLILPNPLLVNFMFYTDPLSKKTSEILQYIVKGETPFPVSSVDVECDEPDTAEIVQRYMIAKYPTVVALQGGNPIGRFYPTKTDEDLEASLKKWIAELPVHD